MPPHDYTIAWAERDDADALDPQPATTLTRRHNRRFDIALAAVLGIAIGIIACAGLAITHHAPHCGVSQIMEP